MVEIVNELVSSDRVFAMQLSSLITFAVVSALGVYTALTVSASPAPDRQRHQEVGQQGAARSLQDVRAKAHDGSASAQFVLAQLLHQGAHMKKDLVEARRWYQAAAEQDYVDAQFALGIMLDNGEGGETDKETAVHWYQRAAAKGHSGARVNLAVSYLHGEGIEQDIAKAVALFEEAGDQGDPRAFFGLALIHEQGRDKPVDLCRAIHFYRKSAHLGFAAAARRLDRLGSPAPCQGT